MFLASQALLPAHIWKGCRLLNLILDPPEQRKFVQKPPIEDGLLKEGVANEEFISEFC